MVARIYTPGDGTGKEVFRKSICQLNNRFNRWEIGLLRWCVSLWWMKIPTSRDGWWQYNSPAMDDDKPREDKGIKPNCMVAKARVSHPGPSLKTWGCEPEVPSQEPWQTSSVSQEPGRTAADGTRVNQQRTNRSQRNGKQGKTNMKKRVKTIVGTQEGHEPRANKGEPAAWVRNPCELQPEEREARKNPKVQNKSRGPRLGMNHGACSQNGHVSAAQDTFTGVTFGKTSRYLFRRL